ncbi:MAG: hypothetical protein Q9163_004233 [Psora crenata]
MPSPQSNLFFCATCLKRVPNLRWSNPWRRLITTGGNPALPPETAFASLPTRRLISLHGPDASQYLHGLITTNIPGPDPERTKNGFYSAFLNASGRVLHDVFIYPTQHSKQWQTSAPTAEKDNVGYLIEVDAKEVDALAKHLKRYKLRARIGVRVLDDGEWRIYSAWGNVITQEEINCRDLRVPPDMGLRIIMPGDTKPEVHFDAEESTGPSYGVHRILLGVPEGQTEIPRETALPQESNIDYMRGIDFRKGCYIGQELTIRTHHTGVVRKRILPVQLYGQDEKPPETLTYNQRANVRLPPHGLNISRVNKKGRSAGKWLGGVGNVGLALCRLEVMTDTALTGEGSQLSPDDEFRIDWESEVDGGPKLDRVKAFVPAWHKERAEEQRVQRPNG